MIPPAYGVTLGYNYLKSQQDSSLNISSSMYVIAICQQLDGWQCHVMAVKNPTLIICDTQFHKCDIFLMI